MISNTWTRENLAYLAGLLEGEGSFSLTKGRYPKINLKMTDEDVVRHAWEIAGVGSFSGPYTSGDKSHYKDYWLWQVYNQYHSYALLVALLPWFRSRRSAKIIEIIKVWHLWRKTDPKHGNINFGKDMNELRKQRNSERR